MKRPRIGIIDSGVGGITVWAEIVKLMPGVSTVYYADSANCPYGGRSDDEIIVLTQGCVERLLECDVKLIVLACNTITAAAVDVLRVSYPGVIFVGMEPAVKPAALATSSGVVGVLATRATLRGRLYHDTAQRWAEGVKLIEVAGDGLVELVEREMAGTAQCDALLNSYIEPMVEQGADYVVLGCTHYPFLSSSIERLTCGKLHVVQPAAAVALRVKFLLENDRAFGGEVQATGVAALPVGDLGVERIFMSSSSDLNERERISRMAWKYFENN